MSEARERPLRWRERFALRLHLRVCAACRDFRKQLDFIAAAMRRYLPPEG
jgi:hypothetical protein